MEAEAELRESEAFLDSVFESIQDGISVLDGDLTIKRVNPIMNEWYAENNQYPMAPLTDFPSRVSRSPSPTSPLVTSVCFRISGGLPSPSASC